MANQNGRPIAPARKLIAAVLGTVAVFVMVFGAGLGSWAIAILGMVMLGLSITLALVNVGRRGARAWVAGSAQVKAVSDPPVSARYGRAELQLVVVAPGLPVTEVLVREPRVPVEKWPRPGGTLPVQVDVDDMRRVRIDWSTAPDNVELPPPGHSYDASYPDPQEEFDDDLLGEPEPPPWATAGRDWGLGPDEPPPPPPGPVIDHGPMADPRNDPVIVHDTPAGAVVEGRVVDQPEPAPLPRRARSGPIPSPSPPSDPTSEAATAPRTPGSRPRPHPRRSAPASAESATAMAEDAGGAGAGAATATVDPDEGRHGSFAAQPPGGTPAGSTEATAEPAPSGSPPGQRSDSESFPAAGGTSIDIPLDDLVRPATAPGPAAEPGDPFRSTATPGDGARPTAGAFAVAPETGPRADTRPVAPEPVAPDPVAPEPVSTPPVAPEPVNGTVGAAPPPAAGPHDPAIDLALDGDPEPPPETRPDARPAVAAGIVAPPVEEIPEPGAAQPRTAQPSVAQPGATQPGTTQPGTTQPGTAQPGTTQPGTTQPGTAQPDVAGGAAAAPVPEVPTGEPSVISGIDEPPAVGGATRGHWADLEGGYDPDERVNDVITAYPTARPGPAGAIHGVGFMLMVTDLERSTAFYRDTLGFFPIDTSPGSAVLASGDTRLVLRTGPDDSANGGRPMYLNLEVGDIDAMYAELKAKGVTFMHPPRLVNRGERLELWSATLTDPDGHHIAVSQWRAVR